MSPTRPPAIHAASRPLLARIAGALYFTAVATAVLTEFIAPGLKGRSAFVLATACYAAVMLLLYAILKTVNWSVALIATLTGLSGFAVDALHWKPYGINADIPIHGLFCILIGWLFFGSAFVPRALAALMACAGLAWLLYLAPSLVHRLAPFISFAGLLCEAIPMLWLLFMGIGNTQGHKFAAATEVLS